MKRLLLLLFLMGCRSDCGDQMDEIGMCARRCKEGGGRMKSYENKSCICEYPEK